MRQETEIIKNQLGNFFILNSLDDDHNSGVVNNMRTITAKKLTNRSIIRDSSINPVTHLNNKKSPEENGKDSRGKESELNRGSTNASRVNSNETPNPMREQTPSQCTNAKSPSPEEVKEPPKPK